MSKEVSVSKELFDRTFKEKCEWQDKYWKVYDELVEKDREITRLIKEIEKLHLELDSTNSTLKKYANKLIRVAHLHDHYVEYDYREFDKLLEEVLYNE